MRTLLRAHTISGIVSEAEVLASVCGNDDVLFHWDLLTGVLNIETKSTLLQEFVQLWLTIRVHAFTKMVLEEHKHDKQVTKSPAKALPRAALYVGGPTKRTLKVRLSEHRQAVKRVSTPRMVLQFMYQKTNHCTSTGKR